MRRLQDELTNAVRTDIACIEREVSRLIEQAEGDISVLQRHAGMRPLIRGTRVVRTGTHLRTPCSRMPGAVAATTADLDGARLVQGYMRTHHASMMDGFARLASPGITTGSLRQAVSHTEYQLTQLRDLAVRARYHCPGVSPSLTLYAGPCACVSVCVPVCVCVCVSTTERS